MPRVRVAALIVDDEDRVVVVRHRLGSSTYHLLPGGGVDYGETLEEALVREVSEETGLQCEVGRPVVLNDTISPDGARHVVNITFLARMMPGQRIKDPVDERVEAVELVAVSALGQLDFRPPIAAQLMQIVAQDAAWECAYVGSVYADD